MSGEVAGFPGLQSHPSHCVYCSRRIPADLLEWDHIVPRSRGGADSQSNKLPCCGTCNRIKMAMLPFVEWVPPRPLPGLEQYLNYSLLCYARQFDRVSAPAPCPRCDTIVTDTYLRSPRVASECPCHATAAQAKRVWSLVMVDCEVCGMGIEHRPAPGRRPPRFCDDRCRSMKMGPPTTRS